jgi:hypothetical protein
MTSTDGRHWYRRARFLTPVGFALGFALAAGQNVQPATTTSTPARTVRVTVTASAHAQPAQLPKTTTPAPAKAKPLTLDGDGTYIVGTDIQPGRWKADGSDLCYWARLKDDSGDFDAIITNHAGAGRATVTVARTDGAFTTTGCGTWTRQ